MGRVNELGAAGTSASNLDDSTFLFGYYEMVPIRRLSMKTPRGQGLQFRGVKFFTVPHIPGS